LQISFVDLVIKISGRMLQEGVYLIENGAVLLLLIRDDLL
jgi:hypothetical protein